MAEIKREKTEEQMEEPVEIPRVGYSGKDEVLKEQVVHYEKGTRRILIFTVVGLLLGWFSYCYYGADFFPLKVILAVPYKLSECLHQALHEEGMYRIAGLGIFGRDAFFPQAPYVSVFAEYGMPALFGGAIYGSLAYFTGDKRIFTLAGYVRFGCAWAAVISVCTVALFSMNSLQVRRNNCLTDLSGLFVIGDSGGRGFYADYWEAEGDRLKEAFYEGIGPEEVGAGIREPEQEQELDLIFGSHGEGAMLAWIHPEKGYLVTDQGKVYQMTDAFMKLYRECLEGWL